MAAEIGNSIRKVQTPDGVIHPIYDERIPAVDSTPTSGSTNVVESGGIKEAIMESAGEVIIGTQTGATGNWTGVSKLATASDMKSGYRFTYWLPYAGSGNATLTLTFQDGTTKAINCYIRGASRLTTHIPAGSKVDFCYLENASVAGTTYTGAWIDPGYWDGDSYDRIYSNYERRFIYSTATPLYRYKICGYNNGKIVPLVVTNQTSATIVDKTPITVGLDPYAGLVIYTSTTQITSTSSAIGNLYNELAANGYSQYTFNDNVPAYKDVYLKGTIGEDGLFYLDTTTHNSWYVFAPNRESDGEYNSVFEPGSYYMFVGPSYTSANYFQLKYNNPVYCFDGEKLIPLDEMKSSEVKEETEFLYRKSPSITQGYYSAKEINGKTLVYNQLVNQTKLERNKAGDATVSGMTLTVSIQNTQGYTSAYLNTNVMTEWTHKYYVRVNLKPSSALTFWWSTTQYGQYSNNRKDVLIADRENILTRIATGNYTYLWFGWANAAIGDTITFNSYKVIDLTLMFGAGNEPATVEEFEALFPLPYYDYNLGELISFNAEGIQTVGRNLVDINTFPELTGRGEIDANGAWHLSSLSVGVTLWKNTIGYTGRLYYDYAYKYANGGNKGAGQRFKFVYTDGTSSLGVHSTIGKVVESFQTDYGTFVESWISDVFLYFLTDPQTDGTDGYIPYRTSVLNLSISSMTSGGVTIFPDGMRSAGDAHDEAIVDSDGYVRKVVKKIGDVDLGTLTWNKITSTLYGGTWSWFSVPSESIDFKNPTLNSITITCAKYVSIPSLAFSNNQNKMRTNSGVCMIFSDKIFYIRDDSYTDAASFKTAMSGVMLYYELATPEEYTLDNPIFVGTEYYSGGIQKVLPENTSEPTTAPFRGKFGYRDYSYAEKQDKLTFDTIPTANSTNVVTSGGVYDAIDDAQVWEAGSGSNSAVLKGSDGTAAGNYSTVEGYKSETGGTYTGNNISISGHDGTNGSYSHAEGLATIASGPRGAHAEGAKNLASGAAAHVEGGWNKATAQFSHAEGYLTTASNESAHTEGRNTIASGIISHAEGNATVASGSDTHSEGRGTVASGTVAHAEGAYTKATNDAAHSEGYYSEAAGDVSHAEGRSSIAKGNYSHAEGHTVTKGILSHSENGDKGMEVWPVGEANATTYTSTFDEEWRSVRTAVGDTVFANIIKSTTIELKSSTSVLAIKITNASYSGDTLTFTTESTLSTTALNGSTEYWINLSVAYGARSHSENMGNTSYGEGSHSEGEYTVAIGDHSHSEGIGTITNNEGEHAEGRYNKSTKTSATYGNAGNTQHSIGIGTSSARKNAVEVMQNGDMYVVGLGGYDGTNPTATTSSSIQSIVSGIVTQLSDIETVLDQIIQPTS